MMYGGLEIQLHVFLTSALEGRDCWASRSGRIAPGKGPQNLFGRFGNKNVLILPGIEPPRPFSP
jgi:hypothetical protein